MRLPKYVMEGTNANNPHDKSFSALVLRCGSADLDHEKLAPPNAAHHKKLKRVVTYCKGSVYGNCRQFGTATAILERKLPKAHICPACLGWHLPRIVAVRFAKERSFAERKAPSISAQCLTRSASEDALRSPLHSETSPPSGVLVVP
jgi:hypothetical protein